MSLPFSIFGTLVRVKRPKVRTQTTAGLRGRFLAMSRTHSELTFYSPLTSLWMRQRRLRRKNEQDWQRRFQDLFNGADLFLTSPSAENNLRDLKGLLGHLGVSGTNIGPPRPTVGPPNQHRGAPRGELWGPQTNTWAPRPTFVTPQTNFWRPRDQLPSPPRRP